MRARLLEEKRSKVPHEELRCEASSDEEDVVDIGKRTSLSFLLLTPSTLLEQALVGTKDVLH